MGNSLIEDMEPRRRSGRQQKTGVRGARLEELILEELSSFLACDVEDPRLDGARLARVTLSPDGSRARIGFSIPALSDDARRASERAFKGAAGFFRRELCHALDLKRTPELTFVWDPGPLADAEENG